MGHLLVVCVLHRHLIETVGTHIVGFDFFVAVFLEVNDRDFEVSRQTMKEKVGEWKDDS